MIPRYRLRIYNPTGGLLTDTYVSHFWSERGAYYFRTHADAPAYIVPHGVRIELGEQGDVRLSEGADR